MSLTKVGQNWSDIGEIWHGVDQAEPDFGKKSPKSTQCGTKLTEFDHNRPQIDIMWPEFGRI